MTPDGPIKLVSQLLDLPLLDKDKRWCGVVDDIEQAAPALQTRRRQIARQLDRRCIALVRLRGFTQLHRIVTRPQEAGVRARVGHAIMADRAGDSDGRRQGAGRTEV